jgi:pimeloyl-ACP methyl ester carboxylesterase
VAIDLTDRIPTITAPALLLWGDADPISPVSAGRSLASLLPKSHLVVVPGGDHAFVRDRADEVAPHVARHLGP